MHRWLVVLAFIAVTALMAGASAAAALFTHGATAGANTVATATLEPPAGLGVSFSCTGAAAPAFAWSSVIGKTTETTLRPFDWVWH
jgi:hypothetical protein